MAVPIVFALIVFYVIISGGVLAAILASRRRSRPPAESRHAARVTSQGGQNSVLLALAVVGAVFLAGIMLIALPVFYFSFQSENAAIPTPAPTPMLELPVSSEPNSPAKDALVSASPGSSLAMATRTAGDHVAVEAEAAQGPMVAGHNAPFIWTWGAVILMSLILLTFAAAKQFGAKIMLTGVAVLLAPVLLFTLLSGVSTHRESAVSMQASTIRMTDDQRVAAEHWEVIPPGEAPIASEQVVDPTAAKAAPFGTIPTESGPPSLWTDGRHGDMAAAPSQPASVITAQMRLSIVLLLVFSLIGTAILVKVVRPNAIATGAIIAVVMIIATFTIAKVRTSVVDHRVAETGPIRSEMFGQDSDSLPQPVRSPATTPIEKSVDEGITVTVAAETPTAPTAGGSDQVGDRRFTEYLGASSRGRILTEWPTWVNAKDSKNPITGDESFVMQSGWYATPLEAEMDLVERMRPRLQSFLAQQPGAVDLSSVPVDFDLVHQNNLVSRRLHEESTLETTSHREPIFQVTWEFQLRDSMRRAIAANHLPNVQQLRLFQVGVGFGLLTLLFGTWAAYFRLNDYYRGAYQTSLRMAAMAVTALSSTLLFLG